VKLANLPAALTTIDVGAKSYQIGPFRYQELVCLQLHLDQTSTVPAPRIGDDRWASTLFATIDGVMLFLSLLFSMHQEFTADDLADLIAQVGPNQIGPLFAIAIATEEDTTGSTP
jgi:hypothetical protein